MPVPVTPRRIPKRDDAAGRAYGELRDALLSGVLRPGERIDLGAVAHWLDMSRTPVDHAITRLCTDGLVTVEPYRGTFVRPGDPERFEATAQVLDIVHDAVLAPLVVAVSLVVRRAGRRVRPAVLAIVQTTVIVGAVLSIVVVPEIIAKAKGTKNDTVLPFDYGARLGLLWLVLALLAAATIAVYLAVTRRQKVRPEADQV